MKRSYLKASLWTLLLVSSLRLNTSVFGQTTSLVTVDKVHGYVGLLGGPTVFSSGVGIRKPHAPIFERALEALGVRPDRALFVGDRLYEDVRGAGELGMTTVQALWFRADEHPDGREPDFQAFTMHDVLNVVRRLLGEG